ncbi:MAG: hypothetical protein QX191_07945 [Methylococcaceae bacterium]
MKKKYLSIVISLSLTTLISGCSTLEEKPEAIVKSEPAPMTNDYPTRDRVEYVLNCVAQHGGLTYITQYACGCKIDKIAEKMTFAEFEAAKTFTYLSKGQTGDAGAAFRDPAQSKDLRKRIKEAEASAEKSCFVK